MREDLSAALKKVTMIASYLEAKAELGNELHEEDAFIAPPHLEAMAGILKVLRAHPLGFHCGTSGR